MASNNSRTSQQKGKRPNPVLPSATGSSGPTPVSRGRKDRSSADRETKRKRTDVGRSSSVISISSDESPVRRPAATTRDAPAPPQTPATDSALREVLRTAFDANAKLNREHEMEIRNVRLSEQEATDRATKLQQELHEAEAALAKLQAELDDCVADRAVLFEQLDAARSRAAGTERKLEVAMARAGDLEREVNAMCEHAELLRIELSELESAAMKHEGTVRLLEEAQGQAGHTTKIKSMMTEMEQHQENPSGRIRGENGEYR